MSWTRETELRSARVHRIQQHTHLAQGKAAQLTFTVEVLVEYRPYIVVGGNLQAPPRNQVIASLWRARRPGVPIDTEDNGVALTEFMPLWVQDYVTVAPIGWPLPDDWTTTYLASAEVKVNTGSLWSGRYALLCVVHQARYDATPTRLMKDHRLATTQLDAAALSVLPDAKAPKARNNLPISMTNLYSVIPDPAMNVVQTDDAMIPFTLERTGYPVLDLKMLAIADGATLHRPAEIASWVIPKLDAIERSVSNLPVDQQLFSTVYLIDAPARSAGIADAPTRDSSNKLMRMCRAAASKAIAAPKDEHYARRLRGPLETAQEAIAVDPDNAGAYLWTAYLHALLGAHDPLLVGEYRFAFDYFLTLVFRLRLAERTLAGFVVPPNAILRPEASPTRRAIAALRGRVGADFWTTLARTAELLQLKGRIKLDFPHIIKDVPA